MRRRADYRGDYWVTTGRPFPLACCSHLFSKSGRNAERPDYTPRFQPSAVVRAVVTKNGGFPRLSALLTTDYSLSHKKEEQEKKCIPKGYARATVVSSQAPRP